MKSKNKALWIFDNIRELVNEIEDKSERNDLWGYIIEYGFGVDVDESSFTFQQRVIFRAIKPLIRLRGIAGSQFGVSNNPSGRESQKSAAQPNIAPNIAPIIGANIGANEIYNRANPLITETKTETKTVDDKSSLFDKLSVEALNNTSFLNKGEIPRI